MFLAPIAFFAYKRPEHTRRSLESLSQNIGAKNSELFIYCDGAKRPEDQEAVELVRQVVRSQQWCGNIHIIEHEQNVGCADSVINGVTQICKQYGKVIVIEDDLVLSTYFLNYMNTALDLYESESKVMQISGYMFPINLEPIQTDAVFLPFTTSWGWSTWQRAWKHFDVDMKDYKTLRMDKKQKYKFDLNDSYPYFKMLSAQFNQGIDTWDIQWYLSTFMLDALTLYPKYSLVSNIGFDGTGTHCEISSSLETHIYQDRILSMPTEVNVDCDSRDIVFNYLHQLNQPQSLLQHIKMKLQSIKMKSILKELCPPILWNSLSSFKTSLKVSNNFPLSSATNLHTDHQDLDIYWNSEMAEVLETWGEGNVWSEIQFLMANCNGRVLDIACGTGKTMEIISRFPNIEVYGIDISDLLISKALERGISQSYLKIGDATNTGYISNFFKYSYSIGSLEHFTNEGISQFISESYKITETASFHMLPVSRSGKDEGWMKTLQSFHNNSLDWWLDKFYSSYPVVFVVDSYWKDDISVGKWFICFKHGNEVDRNAI